MSAAQVVDLHRHPQPRSFGAVLQLPGYRIDVEAFQKAAIAQRLLSADQLARKAKVATRQVWRLYEGQPLPYRSLMKIAAALGLAWPTQVLIPAESESAS